MDSPSNRNKYRKKTSKTQSQSHTTNENTKNNKNTKSNKKNDLKGDSVLENNQDQNAKFISIARKMVDNV